MSTVLAKLAAVLGVVLLAIDAARLLIGFVLQPGALAAGDHAIRLRAGFGATQVYLAGREAARFADE